MDKFAVEIKRQLEKLSDTRCLLFATLTCDHLYPNYVHFQKTVNWGNSEILREAIDTLYQEVVKPGSYSNEVIQILIDAVDLITPDTEDFSAIGTSFALDACTAALSSLEYVKKSNLDDIVDVATYARDTVDMFIQIRDDFNSNDPNIETRIATDPLMVKEKNRQYRIVEKLQILTNQNVDDMLIRSLRAEYTIIDLNCL